jgi:putative two-component system response regulator
MAAVVALQHHENWDGTGYPYQLSASQISLEARVVRICDVYDALREERPYRGGISHEEAIHVIERGDGLVEPRMFDPIVHRAFLECSSKVAHVFAAAYCADTPFNPRLVPGAPIDSASDLNGSKAAISSSR